jgi:tRNA (uracil-5-)-methyltransferase
MHLTTLIWQESAHPHNGYVSNDKVNTRVLYGPGTVVETLGGLAFRVSRDAFFQVNSPAAEVLYGVVKEFCGIQGIVECGGGSAGLMDVGRDVGGDEVDANDFVESEPKVDPEAVPEPETSSEAKEDPKPQDGRACKEDGNNIVLLDLCCGTGTIGLTMAKQVRHVVGIELLPEAIQDAEYNASINGLSDKTTYMASSTVLIICS